MKGLRKSITYDKDIDEINVFNHHADSQKYSGFRLMMHQISLAAGAFPGTLSVFRSWVWLGKGGRARERKEGKGRRGRRKERCV